MAEKKAEMSLRATVAALSHAGDCAQNLVGFLGVVEEAQPEGTTRAVLEDSIIRLRGVRDACLREAQMLRKISMVWCDGEGCDEHLYQDELTEQPDGDLLCPDCARREEENAAEREAEARACDRFNGGGIGR